MPRTSWKIRRRVMFATLAFAMLTIFWVIAGGLDTGPADTVVSMGFISIMSIVGSYVFGAVWDDKNGRE